MWEKRVTRVWILEIHLMFQCENILERENFGATTVDETIVLQPTLKQWCVWLCNGFILRTDRLL
jgi:hypothetical protein